MVEIDEYNFQKIQYIILIVNLGDGGNKHQLNLIKFNHCKVKEIIESDEFDKIREHSKKEHRYFPTPEKYLKSDVGIALYCYLERVSDCFEDFFCSPYSSCDVIACSDGLTDNFNYNNLLVELECDVMGSEYEDVGTNSVFLKKYERSHND